VTKTGDEQTTDEDQVLTSIKEEIVEDDSGNDHSLQAELCIAFFRETHIIATKIIHKLGFSVHLP